MSKLACQKPVYTRRSKLHGRSFRTLPEITSPVPGRSRLNFSAFWDQGTFLAAACVLPAACGPINMVDYETAKKLAYTLLPFVIPWLIGQYRSLRAPGPTRSPRPLPPHVQHALNLLFLASAVALASTLPHFMPENVFVLTSARLHTPSNVLWERVAALRPNRSLTELDARLQTRLTSIEGRCLYLAYGPDAVGNCPFCRTDESRTFFVYALPAILFPHLLNLAALGLATSAGLARREGSRWRAPAVLLGSALALLDAFLLWNYDWRANARATRARELVPWHWQLRVLRGLALAAADTAFAGFLWATATNRLLAAPVGAAERVDAVIRTLEAAGGKLGAVGIVQNTMVRNKALRGVTESYWREEGDVMTDVMAQKEVVDSVKEALASGRIDIARVEMEARAYAESIFRVHEQGG